MNLNYYILKKTKQVAFMDRDVGKADEEFRTSSNYFLPSRTDKLREIDERVARLTRVPRQHQEYVQGFFICVYMVCMCNNVFSLYYSLSTLYSLLFFWLLTPYILERRS
jgi:hypothetical protein